MAAAILAVGVGMYAVARETSVFAIDRIEVAGASPDVADRVRAALDPMKGTSLVVFDAREANRRLAAVADVAAATYDRNFPNTLRVVVRTERSVALLRRGHEAWLASGSARVIRQVVQGPLPLLPRVWLEPTADPLVGAVLDGPAAVAVHVVPAIAKARLPIRVRSVRVVDGEVTVTLVSGMQVLLGDTSGLPLKLAAAARILPDVGDMAYLDVSVPERVVAGTRATFNPQVDS